MRNKDKIFGLILSGMLILSFPSCGILRYFTGKALDHIDLDSLEEGVITSPSLFEKFPELEDPKFNISDDRGMKYEYLMGFYKYYFVYRGDMEGIENYIAGIDCQYSEIEPDTTLIKINSSDMEYVNKDVTPEEMDECSLFYDYLKGDFKNFDFYQCCKTPEMHYLIFDRENGVIYHKIESFRE